MKPTTVHQRINIRARFAKAGDNSVKFEALTSLMRVNHADVDTARHARRVVANAFYRASGKSVARFIGWS